MPKPELPTPTPAKPPGVVRVGLPTVTLSEEQADAIVFRRDGSVPADRRELAHAAREIVRAVVGAAIEATMPLAITKLRAHRHDSELAEAKRVQSEAAARVAEIEARVTGGTQ